MQLQSIIPRLLCGALVVAGLATVPERASAAVVNLASNGGFETGDFTGWTQTGNITFNGVQCPGAGLVPQGNCNAFFGPDGSLGGIQQAIATVVGAQYFISFVFTSDGSSPGNFIVDFGAQNLLNLTNPTAGTTTFGFVKTATSASTLLKFQFRDDPGLMLLDAVQVIPEPTSLALVSLALLGLGSRGRRKAH